MRRSLRNCLVLVALLWLPIGGPLSIRYAQADEKAKADQNQSTSFWMMKKLDYSQQILAGLANADYDAIVASAQSMRNLSRVEGFIRGQTPGYRRQLEMFDEANVEIIRQAQ